jgi:serpin B
MGRPGLRSTGRRLTALAVALATVALLAGCGAQATGETSATRATSAKVASDVLRGGHQAVPSPQAERDAPRAAADSNAFGFDLFGALRPEDKNFVCSPYVISVVLSQAMAGAKGPTRQQFAQVLRMDFPEESLFPALGALDRSLDDIEDFSSVSSLWGQIGKKYEQSFVDLLGKTYGSPLRLVDFGDYAAAAEEINRWMSDATHGRIGQAVDPNGPRPDVIVLMLTSAVYMKAEWDEPFPRSLTHDSGFHLLDGTVAQVPMMNQMPEHLQYMSDDTLQAVEVPYADGRLSCLVVLPEQGRFAEVGQALDADRVDGMLAAMTSRNVTLALPRFTFTSSSDLVPALQTLGLRSAFGSEADFSGMSDTHSEISGVGEQAFILVDEAGTEAAAGATITMSAGVSMDDVFMSTDRPFFFLIRDTKTGAILFLGQVTDPRGEGQA